MSESTPDTRSAVILKLVTGEMIAGEVVHAMAGTYVLRGLVNVVTSVDPIRGTSRTALVPSCALIGNDVSITIASTSIVYSTPMPIEAKTGYFRFIDSEGSRSPLRMVDPSDDAGPLSNAIRRAVDQLTGEDDDEDEEEADVLDAANPDDKEKALKMLEEALKAPPSDEKKKLN